MPDTKQTLDNGRASGVEERMTFVTRDQTAALNQAARMIADSRYTGHGGPLKSIRIYTVEVTPDGLGQSREYYVDGLPPPGMDLVRMVDVEIDPFKEAKQHSHPYKVTEQPCI